MLKQKTQDFLAYALTRDPLGGFFWNVLDLAYDNLDNYSGPRTQQDCDKIVNDHRWSKSHRENTKVLFDIYKSRKDPDTQELLGVFVVAMPLLMHPYQLSSVQSKTKMTTLSCYEIILANINSFTNQKLKYDLLTRIINRIKEQYDMDKPFVSEKPMDEGMRAVHDVAVFFRATCDYAKTDDPQVRETLLKDMYDFMRIANPSNVKLDYGKKVREILLDKLFKVIKNSKGIPEKEIKTICAQAYKYIAAVGASNQKFMDKIWDEFDWRSIIGVSDVVNKIINDKRGRR